ncbi:hypothetical protein OE88DRAFT_489497 [Heliocybe sulcata]|uniref:Uncharacterized protein n=1 Tax=Heliocybe sulcata TaxID=5364 RepID=A0A5C3MUD1_9AGAM|nr:hypothetical protein OE88DRAFT_489497 [Heliocybe sulcata]
MTDLPFAVSAATIEALPFSHGTSGRQRQPENGTQYLSSAHMPSHISVGDTTQANGQPTLGSLGLCPQCTPLKQPHNREPCHHPHQRGSETPLKRASLPTLISVFSDSQKMIRGHECPRPCSPCFPWRLISPSPNHGAAIHEYPITEGPN